MSEGRHYFLTANSRAARIAAIDALRLPPRWLDPISAHRRLRGSYTAAGTLLRAIVPTAVRRWPDLVAEHQIEILTIAPELTGTVEATQETLTSLAVPAERTRYYSSLRTLRLAHGVAEFLTAYLQRSDNGGSSLVIDDIQEADYTDQELLAVLLRRLDASLLTVVLAGTPGFGTMTESESAKFGDTHLPFGKLDLAISRWCERVIAPEPDTSSRIALAGVELGRIFVDSDGTDDRPVVVAGYQALSPQARATLHDTRADLLAATGEFSLTLGAIPWHRARGSDPLGAGANAIDAAMEHSILMGFYDATIERSEEGRALADWEAEPALWWRFTTRLLTALSAIGRGNEAEAVCQDVRARSDRQNMHRQVSYLMAMLYTRHLPPERRDHEIALGWINQAIALSSLVPDAKERSFYTVFNRNGKALIEAHRGRPQLALQLVTDGITQLDRDLAPDEQLLHRSVLRYNRAQVLVGLGRLEEALADYDSVIALDPNYAEYHFDRGNLLHRLGRDDEALASFEQAVQLSPPFPEVHYNRAELLVNLGELEQAIASFSYVLELDPDYLDAYVNRASAYAELGEAEQAATDVASGLGLDPANPHLLALRAQLELEAGHLETARTAVGQALAADAELAGAWAIRGTLNFTEGALAEALGDFDRALELAPDEAILFNRGSVALALGRFAEAERDFTKVIQADPEQPDGWLERARCRSAAGDRLGARADAGEFCRLAPERGHEVGSLLVSTFEARPELVTAERGPVP
ncbi:MAG TPA: tetratricopeptide repeat protein [Jatrophihabitans sp.]|nr:tetratricopeptide repeat protein [Jatrophihabitans sp.]